MSEVNDIALTTEGDLYFTPEGDIRLINGIYYVRQALSVRLQWFLGEWFLNTQVGIPYYQKILIKNPNMLDVVGYIKRQILTTNGVQSIANFNLTFLPDRAINVTFLAETDYGRIAFDKIYTVT